MPIGPISTLDPLHTCNDQKNKENNLQQPVNLTPSPTSVPRLTYSSYRKANPARSSVANGEQLAHHRATDELCQNLDHGDRSEQSSMIRVIDEGSSEALQRRLFAFTQAAHKER